MRLLVVLVVALVGIVGLGGGAVQGQASRFYIVEDIGTLGTTYTEGLAINEHGDIAGMAATASGDFHAFRYTDATGIQDLGGPALGLFSQAFGINNAGDVVGVLADFDFNIQGFIAPAGLPMQSLFTPERPIAWAYSITDDGRITGQLYAGVEMHPFRTLLTGEIQDLVATGFRGIARAMNADGHVAGDYAPVTYPTSGEYSAFRFSDAGGFVHLGSFGGNGLGSFGLAINASNVIVGCANLTDVQSHAYRARESEPLEDLGTLGGTSSCAEGINANGEIVGWSDTATGQGHAFVYSDRDGMLDVNDLVPSELGLRLVFARAINSRGQIVATSATIAGTRTYRLTPVERDVVAPVITSASATPRVLWPPNGELHAVTVQVAASDDSGAAPQCRVPSVSVLENGVPLPDASGDAQITGDLTLALRARRSGSTVRTYIVGVACSDATGNTATTSVTVTVPVSVAGQ